MKLSSTARGFTLGTDSFAFDFESHRSPQSEDGLWVLDIEGNVPVPHLEKCDRLILPVEEGIAIEVGKSYTRGELDIDHIGAEFLCRNAAMSMVLVERNRQFLLICLNNES